MHKSGTDLSLLNHAEQDMHRAFGNLRLLMSRIERDRTYFYLKDVDALRTEWITAYKLLTYHSKQLRAEENRIAAALIKKYEEAN